MGQSSRSSTARRRTEYGYRTVTKIPPLVGGHGALTEARIKIGHSYRSGGTKREYLSARCSRNVLKAYGKFIFEDKTIISGTIFKPCQTTD